MSDTPRTDALKAFQEKEYYVSDYAVRLHYFEGFARELERENATLRSALTTLLAWEDKGGDIPPTAARGLFRIARAALDSARKEAQP